MTLRPGTIHFAPAGWTDKGRQNSTSANVGSSLGSDTGTGTAVKEIQFPGPSCIGVGLE